MRIQSGFSLIEMIVFIVVTGILASTLLVTFSSALLKTSTDREAVIALQTAQQCMEWYIGQRRINGFSSIACSASPATPGFCTIPSGYTFSNSITCTTLNTDTNYKLITISVSGPGSATLKSFIADY